MTDALRKAAQALIDYEDAGPDDGRGGWLYWEEKFMALRAALAAADEYERKNPLGGPASVFRAAAERIEAGEDYDAVLRDYGLAHVDEREALAAPQPVSFSPETVLPDGSAFFTASFPLPKDHWLYAPRDEWDHERDDYAELPSPILDRSQKDAVVAAVRYAVRGATMCGKEMDFDPDALVLNAVYALCGPVSETASAQAEQPEPVATLHDDGYFTWASEEARMKYGAESQWAGWRMSVYAAPPTRKPLLDSDIVTMYAECPRSDAEMIEFAREVERAHGIVGGGE